MANCCFGWPIYTTTNAGLSQTPTYSGGSWSASLPLTNLSDRRVSKVARSTDALAASTLANIDLVTARSIGVLALVGHNLSAGATIVWKGGTTLGGAEVYNSGSLSMSFSAATAEDRDGIDFAHVHIPSSLQSARYWRFEITDTSNADGYVEIGRLVIAGKFQPTTNMDYGTGLGLEDDTVRKVTDGGGAIYQEKSVRRTQRLVLNHMAEAEALGTAWKMERLLGKKRQLFYVHDTADTTYLHERSFLAVMRELSGIEYPYASRHSTAIELVEEL